MVTPAGQTDASATAANTLTLASQLSPVFTPLTASNIGVEKQAVTVTAPAQTIAPVVSPVIGVAVGPVVISVEAPTLRPYASGEIVAAGGRAQPGHRRSDLPERGYRFRPWLPSQRRRDRAARELHRGRQSCGRRARDRAADCGGPAAVRHGGSGSAALSRGHPVFPYKFECGSRARSAGCTRHRCCGTDGCGHRGCRRDFGDRAADHRALPGRDGHAHAHADATSRTSLASPSAAPPASAPGRRSPTQTAASSTCPSPSPPERRPVCVASCLRPRAVKLPSRTRP